MVEGLPLGFIVGNNVGKDIVGNFEGWVVGTKLGLLDGEIVDGWILGRTLGSNEGLIVGSNVGTTPPPQIQHNMNETKTSLSADPQRWGFDS
mgnify:CR=1 FL=1|jgi:hypothetical protein|tara:strand:+ start:334 stop:609 length:276 start_codon:yes stop_codon:yes gene_type:complete